MCVCVYIYKIYIDETIGALLVSKMKDFFKKGL